MCYIKHFILSFILIGSFAACKSNSDNNGTTATSQNKNEDALNKMYNEPGYERVVDTPATAGFRPTLPLDQAAFKTEKKEDQTRLTNEFDFMFDRNWKVDGRIRADQDKVIKKEQEEYTFNRDGSYTSLIDGKQGGGTWKGRMQNNAPIITIFPNDLKEKVSEWTIKNTGKNMIWVGTTSYNDNAFMVHFVLKK
ncbi:MAG: hypothetical protein J5I59_05000 [Saprospiraceae bacterium]|nr:hypothetical protein [Saprospiraceae bacterium]